MVKFPLNYFKTSFNVV